MPIYKMDGKKDGLQKYRVRINYTDREGKSRQFDRVAYGKEEAKELERRLHLDLQEETTKKITLQQLYDEYIKAKKYEIRETTLVKIEDMLLSYVMPKLADCKLGKLNASILQRWKTGIEEYTKKDGEGLSLEYKQKIFTTFRTMLNYAVKMEYISKNPLAVLGNFKDAYEEKKTMDFYTSDEFKLFRNAAFKAAKDYEEKTNSIYEWNFYVFFNIAFYMGMRKGEIYALRWTDIDDDNMNISRSISQKLKGADRETPPKNKPSIRTIQIPMPLKTILKEHYERYKTIDGFSDEWRICGGEKCIRDTTLNNRNKQYSSAAELKTIRIHDYRHSHASLLANEGINIQEIARRLGHAKIEETWNTYAHLYPKEAERAISVLNKI